MAITNFIPEVWSAQILVELQKSLVYGSAVNRDYEGDIANYGDTVHITGIAHISVGDYTPHTDIAIEAATDRDAGELVIDQSKYFAFEVDDVEKRQSMNDLSARYSEDAAYQLRDLADQYVAGLMAKGAKSKLDPLSGATATKAYDAIVDLATALDKQNVPDLGRWVIVNPDFYGLLRKDNRFITGSDAAHNTLLNGVVGEIAGMTILKSNNTPAATGGTEDAPTDEGNVIIAGTNAATTFAEQIAKVEAARKEKGFDDIVKGLHLYGAKVVRPECLATVTFKVGK
ncbi:coat protein [Bifidobacterium sp. 82T24]|uniref:P22 phage major capsid protein family protein n=1 Tax=Bifidobacterium pluvialisilvae TaxID=2834436 RepID=UPI001C593C95|nr:P22 phage major capsid protein family protein [Bifidobacterium pluvialisilvae]MBW3088822.1 coat protein [Bifidobacterium pluvialisilvae]